MTTKLHYFCFAYEETDSQRDTAIFSFTLGVIARTMNETEDKTLLHKASNPVSFIDGVYKNNDIFVVRVHLFCY